MDELIREIIRQELERFFKTQTPVYDTPDKVLNMDEVSELIGRSKSWIYQNKDILPLQIYEGRCQWRKQDIIRWLEETQQEREKITHFTHPNKTIVRPAK